MKRIHREEHAVLPQPRDIQAIVEPARFRHRERDPSHIAALKAGEPPVRMVTSAVGRFASIRPDHGRSAPRALGLGQLADRLCRLQDGTIGLVATHQSQGGWVAVCFRSP